MVSGFFCAVLIPIYMCLTNGCIMSRNLLYNIYAEKNVQNIAVPYQ